MAMAARRERGLYDPDPEPGTSVFDHYVYCFVSDGDMEEGISHEVARSRATTGSATSSSCTTTT